MPKKESGTPSLEEDKEFNFDEVSWGVEGIPKTKVQTTKVSNSELDDESIGFNVDEQSKEHTPLQEDNIEFYFDESSDFWNSTEQQAQTSNIEFDENETAPGRSDNIFTPDDNNIDVPSDELYVNEPDEEIEVKPQPKVQNVVVIGNKLKENSRYRKGINKAGNKRDNNTTIVGDGEQSLDSNEIDEKFDALSELSEKSAIMYFSHGKDVKLGEEKGQYGTHSEQENLDHIGKKIQEHLPENVKNGTSEQKPVMMVYTCHGGTSKPPEVDGKPVNVDHVAMAGRKNPASMEAAFTKIKKTLISDAETNFEKIADLIPFAETMYVNGNEPENKITGPKPQQKMEGAEKEKETYDLSHEALKDTLHKNVDKLAELMNVGQDSPEYKRASRKIDEGGKNLTDQYRENIYQTAIIRDDSAKALSALQSGGISINDDNAFGVGRPLLAALTAEHNDRKGNNTVKKLLEYGANTDIEYESNKDISKTIEQIRSAEVLDRKMNRIINRNVEDPIALVGSSIEPTKKEAKSPDLMKRFIAKSGEIYNDNNTTDAQKEKIENLFEQVSKNPKYKEHFDAALQDVKDFQSKGREQNVEKLESKLREKRSQEKDRSETRETTPKDSGVGKFSSQIISERQNKDNGLTGPG